MNYEKLHKDTITKLQEMVNSGKITVETACGICADFVPESEDERIREKVITTIHLYYGEPLEDEAKEMIAWLEKQGEQKPAEKKELKKDEKEIEISFGAYDSELQEDTYFIPKGFHVEINDDKVVIKKGEKPNVWSEEDENIRQWIISDIDKLLALRKKSFVIADKEINWLKSLKDRVQPQQKQEWSEDDEQYLLVCKNALRKYQTTDKWDASIISHWLENKLKSVNPQNTWKPSDEQMKQLGWIAKQNKDNMIGKELMTLYQDLLKQGEE